MEAALGRRPAGGYRVAVRAPDGAPVVIANDPLLYDGTPMPTLYWLVAPDLRSRVSRLESEGGVRRAEAGVDPGELIASHERYAAERDRILAAGHAGHSGPRPSGGVGGTRRGVKCLHAHLAWHLAGGEDPVGLLVAGWLGIDTALYVVDEEHAEQRMEPGSRPG
ncbi:MAG: DUF501 domain-containing protein [Acidimicrobiales bacterium]|nr:DUF501 domain-containing protein [Actinomycetota bacterium]